MKTAFKLTFNLIASVVLLPLVVVAVIHAYTQEHEEDLNP